MADMTVVILTAEDYDAVRDLWIAAGLSIRPVGRDSRAQFAAQLAGDTQTVIGLRAGEQLIGVIVATHDGRKGWLNRLAIHPDFRRQGLGQRLIAAAEQQLHDQGMRIIAALIEDWNDPSLALFQKVGYMTHPDIHYLTKRDADDV
ncbi:MAG: GNAT family N-acetyltransferase [Anaerolineae bacterium]|nr:GNAT family N-acetyltransferase [Anaerolineae bacterium]